MSLATFIEANAGTGKTFTLTNYILSRVEENLPLDRICAVTFTEKAANELVDRLRQKITERIAAGAMEPEVLDQSNRCFIGTIHAFCTQILKRYGSKLNLSPLFSVDADEYQFQQLFASRWDQFLAGVMRREVPPYERLIGLFGFRVLEELALIISRRRHDFVRTNSDISWMRDLLLKVEKWEMSGTKKWEQALLQGMQDPNTHRDAMLMILSTIYTFDDIRWKNAVKDFLNCRDEELHLAIDRLREDFVQPLLTEYRALGFLRYDDLILDVRDLLRDHPDVRRRVKQRYDLVLVDEMQDTDPVQYELFLYICESMRHETRFVLPDLAMGTARLDLEPGKLFVVGDPKQSIYGFRSADSGAYERIKEILEREEVRVQPLTDNYRSCDNIVRFSNSLAQRLFPFSGVQDSVTMRRDLCTGSPMQDCVHLVNIVAEEGDLQHLRILAEANWLAQKIREMKKPYKSIGILLRKLTNAHLYIDALSARGIPVVIEGEKYFFQSQEVIDFLNLLKCIVDDLDTMALAGALRSPLFGLYDQELATYFLERNNPATVQGALLSALPPAVFPSVQKRKGRHFPSPDQWSLDFVAPPEPERAKPFSPELASFLETIDAIRKDLRKFTPGRFIDEVLRRFPILTIAGTAYGSYRSEIAPLNILKIHRQALDADQDPMMSPRRFVKMLEQFSREAKELGQETIADEGVDAVKMMSIHRAKGLDFPIVFVPMTDYGMTSFEGFTNVVHDWKTNVSGIKVRPYTEANYLKLAYGTEEPSLADEEDRVLYVAATRAKEQLYFSLVSKGLGKNHRGALIMNRIHDLHPEVPVVEETATPWIEADPELTSVPTRDLDSIRKRWEEIEIKKKSMSRPQMATITTEAKMDIEIERDSSSSNEHPLLVGILCHAVLERIDFKNPENYREFLQVEASKLSSDHTSIELERAVRESDGILREFFQSEAGHRLAAMEIVGREVPLTLFDPVGTKVLSGTIDLLARNGEKYCIIDYKTDVSIDELSRKAYTKQLQLYAQALASSLPSAPSLHLCLLRSGRLIEIP